MRRRSDMVPCARANAPLRYLTQNPSSSTARNRQIETPCSSVSRKDGERFYKRSGTHLALDGNLSLVETAPGYRSYPAHDESACPVAEAIAEHLD